MTKRIMQAHVGVADADCRLCCPIGRAAGSAGTFVTLAAHCGRDGSRHEHRRGQPVDVGRRRRGCNARGQADQHPQRRHRKSGRPPWRSRHPDGPLPPCKMRSPPPPSEALEPGRHRHDRRRPAGDLLGQADGVW